MSEKVKEPLSLKIKKKWLKSKPTTALIVLVLITVFIVLNLWIATIDLAQIDLTENKVYSLTEQSIEIIKGVDKEVRLYAYGYVEDSSLVDLLKQYCRENDNITFEILTEETNKGKVEEYGLTDNYPVVVVEVDKSSTILDGQSEFNSYDYTTGQSVDLTEQKITNAILNLTIEEKAKVYILAGHEEYTEVEMSILTTYLENEAYEYETINLLTKSNIPEDCDVLLIMSPNKDLLDNEVAIIMNYINNGGNIIYTKDTEENGKKYPNYQKILDLYGLAVENGYVYETKSTAMVAEYPNIVMPQIEQYSDITSEIYSDGGYLLFPYAQKIIKANEEKATDLNVKYETLLKSSEKSYYVTDVSANISTVIPKAKQGSFELALVATKTINSDSKDKQKESKIIVIGNGMFISDTIVNVISSNYPISFMGNNKDFMMNSIAYLTDRSDKVTIRKEMNNSTYAPTEQQDTIVKLVIFGIPVLIIVAGIIVWNVRKNKK